MTRRTRLDADVVRLSGHHPRQRAGQIRKAALADVAVADEMVDRAAEQIARMDARTAATSEFWFQGPYQCSPFAIVDLTLEGP